MPCKICGRTFFPVALKKHGPICQKTATKKRKTFDSSRQRAEGTDIPTVKPLKPRVTIYNLFNNVKFAIIYTEKK